MIYLVNEATERIIDRCDAWETGGLERLEQYAKDEGYSIISETITSMGDMIIWVREG